MARLTGAPGGCASRPRLGGDPQCACAHDPATVSDPGGLCAATAKGQATRRAWVADGEVVTQSALAFHWRTSTRTVQRELKREQIFGFHIDGQTYVIAEFLRVDRLMATAVSSALRGLSPETKLVFWKRAHGALGGRTVCEILESERPVPALARVTELAQVWVAEDGVKRPE